MIDQPDQPRPKLSPRRAALARWAAIALPIVIGLRALLLVFQLHSEHHPQSGTQPPDWPPSPGQALEFRAGDRAIRDWSATTAIRAFPARVLTKNLAAAEKDTGCLLNPAAMAANGGTLTLLAHAGDDGWRVRWRGGPTVPQSVATAAGSSHAADMDRLEASMLAAADCGMIAQLQLSDTVLHDLVNILAGRPLVRGGPDTPEQMLKIRVPDPPIKARGSAPAPR